MSVSCRVEHSQIGFCQSEASLYTEIDKLSSAWEALDNQVQSKVFDLTSMEERLQKSSVEVCF